MVNRIQGFKFKKRTEIPIPPSRSDDGDYDDGDDDSGDISGADLAIAISVIVCCLTLFFTACLTGIIAISWIFLGGIFDHFGILLRLYAVVGVVFTLCIACGGLTRYLEKDK